MTRCPYCSSVDNVVLSSDPFGDEVVLQCVNCEEVYYSTKDDLDNESNTY